MRDAYVRLAEMMAASPAVSSPRRRAGWPVVVPGKSLGGPASLGAAVADALIECERAGMPTVLLAAQEPDLDTAVAAVCSYIVGDRAEVVDEAHLRFGGDRVRAVGSLADDAIPGWIGEFSAAVRPSRLQLRFGGIADRLPLLRAAYGKMRGRSERRERRRE